jgi:ribosomal protein S18 acetylase RimI-like enzyme
MATRQEPIDIRPLRPTEDASALRRLDTSFSTTSVYQIDSREDGFTFAEGELDAPVVKRFELRVEDDLDGWDLAWVAWTGPELAGFIAVHQEDWHSRLVIDHLYIAPAYRRKGVGRRLVEVSVASGKEHGARVCWLETSNVNYPAIQAYRSMGFEVCGLDESFYRGTPAEGEVAVFMAKEI